MDKDVCSKCLGTDKCTKSCIMHTGKALVDFIKRIDVTETKIGEYTSKKLGTPYDLVIYGHQLYDLNSASSLLTDIGVALDKSDKFLKAYDKNAFQIATTYCKAMGLNANDTKEITDKIRKINQNINLVLPFKPHSNCEFDVTNSNGKTDTKKSAYIHYIMWVTDKETHKLKCTVGINYKTSQNASLQHIKMDIKDYIDKFRLSQLDLMVKGDKHDKDLIKVTDYGIFKPILIKDKNTSVAIDATYVYQVTNDSTRIIGFWDSKDNLIIDKSVKSKAINKIKDNVDYIKNHKKYIAPYMLFEPNIIEIGRG